MEGKNENRRYRKHQERDIERERKEAWTDGRQRGEGDRRK